MNTHQVSTDFTHDTQAATGILLTNLGTPNAPTPQALRVYLSEFLWDPRVVDTQRVLWWMILHGVILRIRPARAARSYQKVWMPEGSPLLVISRRQAAALQTALKTRFNGFVVVALGMRYGNPSIASALEQLRAAHVRRVLVFPLYPQYSAATTASTFDAVADALKSWRWIPELRMINHYHDDPEYIEVLATTIQEAWNLRGASERLIFSFHGLPRRYLLLGDPYHCECHKTARLVAQRLGLPDDKWQVTFQSRFGREEWLKPYTDHTLRAWAEDGIKSVDVICPGFSADCLETLEEIAVENRDIFLQSGGENYHYIPALNDRPDHIETLVALVARHTANWTETSADWDAQDISAQLDLTQQRALARGAER